MQPMDFLDHVQPEDGWCAIVGIRSGDVRQTLVETREEVEAAVQRYLHHGRDVYFGVAKYATGKGRTKENVASLKAFWLDIDCGQDKAETDTATGRPRGYVDQVAGLAALQTFCKDVGLPRPTIVDSGRGLHVYWPLTEPVTRAQWEPVAAKLRDTCHNRGFYADDAVFEAARILRVPGTLNFKDEPPAPVNLLHVGKPTALAQFQSLFGVVQTQSIFDPNYTPSDRDLARQNGIGYSFRKIMQRSAEGDGCSQLLHAYTNRATADYPTWFYALSVAAMCEDAETATHKLSEGYAGYDPEEVDKKVATIRKATSCARFKAVNPGLCEGCPHFGNIFGPRELGAVAKKAKTDKIVGATPDGPKQVYTVPKFPAPYYRGEGGGVWRTPLKQDSEEEPICIYEHDIYVVKRMVDVQEGDVIVLRLHLPQDGVREFSAPMYKVTDTRELRKVLSMNGVAKLGKTLDALMDFIIKSVGALQHETKAEIMRQQFGWADNESRFVLGDQEITALGHIYSPPSKTTRKLAKAIGPKGTLDKWKEVWAVYGQPGMEAHQFAALSAFGAPLLRFLNQTGAVINLYNPRSGTGKTTVLNMVNSVYGHPQGLRLQKDDTMNGRLLWVGILNNLPATMDEMTNMTSEEYSGLLYALSNGKGKERMQANTNELRENNTTWQTITVSTSNASFAEKLSIIKNHPEGEMMRLFEYPVGLVGALDTAHAKNMLDITLFENFGHAGPIYLRGVLGNMEMAKNLCQRIQSNVDLQVGLLPKERFWSATVASNIAGGMIARRLGLIDWDIDAIYDWACERIHIMRTESEAPLTDVEQVIGDYLYRHMQNVLVVDDAFDRRTNTKPMPKREPKGELLIRMEPDTKRMYVIAKSFKEYCVKYQLNYGETTRVLEQKGRLIKREPKRLSKGMNVVGDPVHCLCFQMADDFVKLENFIPEEEGANEG